MTFRAFNWLILAFGAAVLVLAMVSCKPPAAPAPTTQPSKPLAVLVGGLGDYQLGDIAADIRHRFPDLEVVEFNGRHAYLSDLATFLKANKGRKILLLGHSYGNDAICEAIDAETNVILWIMFDPVPREIFGTLNVPASVKRTAVVWANTSGLIRANVKHPQMEYLVRDTHSGICHNRRSYDLTEREIAWVLK